MANKNTPVQCLEKTLRCWEDQSLIYEAEKAYNKANNLPEVKRFFPKKWREYRKAVLDGDINRVRQEFVPKNKEDQDASLYGDFLEDFPEDLMWWCRSSRRVFHITHDLELLLKNTKLGDIKWADIEVPFPSFLVTLEDGIKCGGEHSKVFLFTTKPVRGHGIEYLPTLEHPEDHTGIKVCYFKNGTWENYEPMSHLKRELVLKQAASGKSGYLKNAIKRFDMLCDPGNNLSPNGASFLMPVSSLNEGTVGESLLSIITGGNFYDKDVAETMKASQEGPDTFGVFDQILSLIAGLCLYLKTLTPAQTEANVTNERQAKTFELSAVTQEADICTVQSVWKLSDAERTIFRDATSKGSGSEKSTHFRRGTWRRNKGSGDNPDAPRCIWVRPTIVRPDRLAEGSLPQGALTSVC